MIRAYRGVVPGLPFPHTSIPAPRSSATWSSANVQRLAQCHHARRRELHPHRRRNQHAGQLVLHVEHDHVAADRRQPRHRGPLGDAARLRGRRRLPDRHRRHRSERRACRQGLDHRRGRAGPRRHAGAAAQHGDGRSRQGAPAGDRSRTGTLPRKAPQTTFDTAKPTRKKPFDSSS